jgi:hypothetical protein
MRSRVETMAEKRVKMRTYLNPKKGKRVWIWAERNLRRRATTRRELC